jgi:hypothetical protein
MPRVSKNPIPESEKKRCTEPECIRVVHRRKLCYKHYIQEQGIVIVRAPKPLCDCGNSYYAKNMCRSCYMAFFRNKSKTNGVVKQAISVEAHAAKFWEWVVSDLGINGSSGRRVMF